MFGMLQWVSDKTMFLLFSYLIRFLEVFISTLFYKML